MQTMTLQAEVREQSGKGPARQLRMRGLIPAIYYGPGTDAVKLAVSPDAVSKALRGEYRRNQLLELEIDGEKKLAITKDLAVHPLSRALLHVDFYAVSEDRPVETTVPFLTSGRSKGVLSGGDLRKLFRVLPIRAVPHKVPAAITLDITDIDQGEDVLVQDLKLDDGVTVTYPATRRVLYVDQAKAPELEEENAGEGEKAEA